MLSSDPLGYVPVSCLGCRNLLGRLNRCRGKLSKLRWESLAQVGQGSLGVEEVARLEGWQQEIVQAEVGAGAETRGGMQRGTLVTAPGGPSP